MASQPRFANPSLGGIQIRPRKGQIHMLNLAPSDVNVNTSEKVFLTLPSDAPTYSAPSPVSQYVDVKVNLDEAQRFLSLLDKDQDTFLFSSFDDDKERAKTPQIVKPQSKLSTLASAEKWMNRRQAAGANLSYAVQSMSGRKRNLASVAAYRAVFAEMDTEPTKPWPLAPSIIIETSPGRSHVLWLIDPEAPIDAETFAAIERRLVADYGADSNAKDGARTLRLPGTWNLKPGRPPHLVTVIDESGWLYSAGELAAAFPPIQLSTPVRPVFTGGKGELSRFDAPLKCISPNDYGDWLTVGMALHSESSGSSAGLSTWNDWAASSPSWAEGECARKWKSFKSGGKTTGGTLMRLANEGGYKKPEPKPRTQAKKAKTAETIYSAPIPETEPFDYDGAPEFSEEGLALSFAHKHKDDLRYVGKFGEWKHWTGQVWKDEETHLAFDLARKHCRNESKRAAEQKDKASLNDAKTRANVLTLARSDRAIAATTDQWNADNWLFNTAGGVVDLRTGKLAKHDPAQFMTKMATVTPGGKCPKWMAFLSTVTAGNVELQKFLQRVAGYCLTGQTTEHALFFCHGKGGNGKGVFLNTITGIMSGYARPAPIETFTESKNDRHPTELAGLVGARLVTASETEEGRHWAEAKIKQLTGGDPISARFMRGDFFEYLPNFKLFIVGNHKPQIRNVDDAMRRRFHLIPFTVTIPDDQKNPMLTEELRAEWGGILQWMIEGCLDWQRVGLAPPADVKAATDEYMQAEDSTAAWLEEMTDTGGMEYLADLWGTWKQWADFNNIAPGTNKKLLAKLEDRGFKADKDKKGKYILGLKLRQSFVYTYRKSE